MRHLPPHLAAAVFLLALLGASVTLAFTLWVLT